MAHSNKKHRRHVPRNRAAGARGRERAAAFLPSMRSAALSLLGDSLKFRMLRNVLDKSQGGDREGDREHRNKAPKTTLVFFVARRAPLRVGGERPLAISAMDQFHNHFQTHITCHRAAEAERWAGGHPDGDAGTRCPRPDFATSDTSPRRCLKAVSDGRALELLFPVLHKCKRPVS